MVLKKILKDSSIVFVGQYLDTANVLLKQGYLIKLNKNRDSLYKRNLVHPAFSHGMAFYFPQKIEELDNGDLVIAGYARDNKPDSPTKFTWGWLIRTDSMGCSLESTCRVPTNEVEKGPLSIKAFPNPTNDIFTVDLSEIPPNQKTIFKLYNTVDQLVMSQKLDSTADKIEFDVRNLIEGFYIFTLDTEGGEIVGNGKLQVQR
jgi:Secretion system C-terminal sorting domain